MLFCLYFFFFKQKTAYELRISDWSSDVCSSDLFVHRFQQSHNALFVGTTHRDCGGIGYEARHRQRFGVWRIDQLHLPDIRKTHRFPAMERIEFLDLSVLDHSGLDAIAKLP